MAFFSNRLTGWVVARDVAALVAVYIFALTYLPRNMFLEIMNGVLAAICLTVCVVFSPSVVEMLRRGITGTLLMRVAIIGAWADQMLQALARIYFIEFRPEVAGRTFDASYGLPAVGYIIFATLHVVAIGMIDDNTLIRRNVCIVIWAVLGGIAATFMLMGAHRLAS